MGDLQPRRVSAPTPETEVKCRICDKGMEARSMGGHLGKWHKGVKVADYIEKYGESASRDFFFKGRNVAPVESDDETPPPAPKKTKHATIEDEVTSDLSSNERKFYDDYSQEVFGQIDRDISQWPVVMSLTMDMITLTRLRPRLDRILEPKTDKDGKERAPDTKSVDAIVRSIKYTEERIRAQMKSLGISRDEKLKNKAQIRSTPFALISGYLDELERMTPQQAQSLEAEERKLLNTVRERIDKLYLSVAPDIRETEEEDGSLSSLDVERIIADANIEL